METERAREIVCAQGWLSSQPVQFQQALLANAQLRRLISLDGRQLAGAATVWISQQELGHMTRLSRNAVAQVLEDMEASGLLSRRYRRIEIPDIGALSRLG